MARAFSIVCVVLALAACRGVAGDGNGSTEERAGIEDSPRETAGAQDRDTAAGEAEGRQLEITTVEDTLVPGVSAEIRLENLSNRTVGFNLCPKMLERRAGEMWTPLPETRPEACTLELRILAAGETVVGTTGLPLALDPGTYRIVFEGISFEAGDPEVPLADRTTNAFEVE